MATINTQGLSRRDPSLMKCLLATPGYVLVSADISSGEPTITAHYSGDENYRLATYDMVGKKPYYREDMLIIDDIYLMVASRFPGWAGEIERVFNSVYEDKTFAEKWVESGESQEWLAKKVLGHIRGKAKPLILGLNYSMGPKNLVLQAAINRFTMTLKETRMFYRTFWDTFPRVEALSIKLQKMYEKQGYLQNDFGYILYPSKPHKCLNYLIQSSVTGLMHVFKSLFFTACPWVFFMAVIHDEILFEVPEDRLEETKRIFYECVDELNTILNWTVNLRFGWKEGKDWYEAK